PGESACVCAEGDLDSFADGDAEDFCFEVAHREINRTPVGCAPFRDIDARVNRRTPVSALPKHAIKQLFIQSVAVLYGIHACLERRVNAFQTHRMRGDAMPQTMRFVNKSFRLFVREVDPTVKSAVLHVVTTVCVKLDPVRAVLDLL